MQIFGKKDRFFTIFLLFFQKKSFFLRFSRCGCKKRAFVARLSRAARVFAAGKKMSVVRAQLNSGAVGAVKNRAYRKEGAAARI